MDWFYGGDSHEGRSWLREFLYGNDPEKAPETSAVTDSTQTEAPKIEEGKSWSLWGT
jgi:hypothetical protein